MNKNELKNRFRDEAEQMKKYRLASIHAQIEYEKAVDNSDPDLHRYEMILKNAEQEEDLYCHYYAKAIFEYFENKKPILIRKRNNQKVSWNDAFGSDYSKLSAELKGSLVALIEEDGGQYRLA